MRIITFGSRLARLTGLFFEKLHGGTVISSVYHNRSDAFLGWFVDKTWKGYSVKAVTALLLRVDEKANPTEYARAMILRDQCHPWVGLHKLPDGSSIFDALKTAPDLIIVDNENDLRFMVPTKSAKKKAADQGIEGAPPNRVYPHREKISVAQGVKSMKRLLDYFHAEAPGAAIVFIHFPPLACQGRQEQVECATEFEKLFKHEAAWTMAGKDVEVAKGERPLTPQHFTDYANRIAAHLREVEEEKLLAATKAVKETKRVKARVKPAKKKPAGKKSARRSK